MLVRPPQSQLIKNVAIFFIQFFFWYFSPFKTYGVIHCWKPFDHMNRSSFFITLLRLSFCIQNFVNTLAVESPLYLRPRHTSPYRWYWIVVAHDTRHNTCCMFVRLFVRTSYLWYPPWILMRCGLESSGQRPYSYNRKTKRIASLFLLLK